MALDRIPMPSPNYSSRGGAGVRLIVLHTAEGATTIESLGNYFASSDADASSHAGADDKPNTIGVYVQRADKAWTQANANPYAVSLELCAFASWTAADWAAHPVMIENAGRWVGEEAAAFGIPLRSLTADQAQGGAAGVCDHVDLGGWGGGHWDCGDAFPMDRVLQIAAGGTPAEPEPEPEDEDMPAYAIVAQEGSQMQYLSDMATFKTELASPAARDSIVWCIVAAGGRVYTNEPTGYTVCPAGTLDALPTNKLPPAR